jgi:uncharacterized delta-60 repeat protein
VSGFIMDSSYVGIARYLQNGHLDSSFGNNGNRIIPVQFYSLATKIILTGNNKIMLAALQNDLNGNSNLVLIRINSDGTVDPSFGKKGMATTAVANYPYSVRFNTMALDQSGNFVIAGSIGHDLYNTRYDYLLVRCKSSGQIDNSFGDNGKVITPYQNYNANGITDIAIQPDKKIVVTGDNSTLGLSNVITNFTVVRYSMNGDLDSSFGDNGTVITNFSGKNSSSYALTIEPTIN